MEQGDLMRAVQDRDMDTIILCVDNHDLDISEICINYRCYNVSLLELACLTDNKLILSQLLLIMYNFYV